MCRLVAVPWVMPVFNLFENEVYHVVVEDGLLAEDVVSFNVVQLVRREEGVIALAAEECICLG